MQDKFTVLIKNYDKNQKLYAFGKQKIIDMSIDQIKALLEEIPIIDESEKTPIQIITRDLIISKEDKNKYTYEYNKLFFHYSKLKFKNSFQIEDFNNILLNKNPNYYVRYIFCVCYTFLLFLLWSFFFIKNMEIILFFFGINFGNIIIKYFLVWLIFSIIVGPIYFFYKNLFLPLDQKYLITLSYSNSSELFIIKTDLDEMIFFSIQIICIYFLNDMYMPYTTYYLRGEFLSQHGILVIISFIILIIQVFLNYDICRENSKVRKKIIQYLRSYINENDSNYPKYHELVLIAGIEKSKTIEFNKITKLWGILMILFTVIPNVYYFS